MQASCFAWLYWNPPREAFTVPFIDRPIAWYGILFVLGFILSCFILVPVFSRFLSQLRTFSSLDILDWQLLSEQLNHPQTPLASLISQKLHSNPDARLNPKSLDKQTRQNILGQLNQAWKDQHLERRAFEEGFPGAIASIYQTSCFLIDRLCWFVVVGTLLGARLGLVFFYDWDFFKHHPSEIIKIWNGGLASHGGVIGVLIALYLYVIYIRKWIPSLTFLRLTDFISIPSPLVACLIRLGNFINQEIVGQPATVPWAVIFGHPIDGSSSIPRHPIQLYEAFAYLAIFVCIYWLWQKKGDQLSTGFLTGILFILIFTTRFFLEFWKETSPSVWDTSYLQMSQLLSLPCILFGVYLLWQSMHREKLILKASFNLNEKAQK